MQVHTLFRFARSQLGVLALCALVIATSGTASAQHQSEQKNIKSEIHGDTDCIVSAKRWWITWKEYNEAKDDAVEAGDTIDQESMWWYADAERRTSWHVLPYTPPISASTGRVDGEENTRYGSIPQGADIQVGYQHDWKVVGKYGWGSRRQPRVEAITAIQIDPDYEAIIEVENNIDFTAKASLSGTAGQKRPWPQVAKHDVTLIAVDINGKQHEKKGHANATVTPTHSSSATDGTSTTRSWSVNGSVGGSASGPSASIGGSYGQSNTESHSTTTGESMPTVEGKTYGEEMQYHHTTTRVFKVPCGGTARFSRAAQISGNFYTRSMASHGSVSSKGNFAVSNTAKITVTCIPCRDGGEADGDPVEDPSGNNPNDNPGGNPGGNNTPGGGNNPGGNPGGNTPGGDHHPGGSLDPLEGEGVTYTPSFGGRHYPGDWWDNPIMRAGGCIYIDPRSFDRFLPIPESQAHEIDPWFFEQDGRIPLVVPDHNDWSYVAAARSVADVILRPFPGTPTFVLLGLNRVEFDGPFVAIDPATGVEHRFGGGFVEFAVGGAPRLEGSFQLRLMPGDRLEQRVEGTRQILETFNEESELPTSVTILDEQMPGAIVFERSVYMPDVFFDLPLSETVETVDVDLPPVEEAPEILFVRSDVNGDGVSDISDVVSNLQFLFGARSLKCLDAADVTGDANLDIADPVFALFFIFMGAVPPPAPFPGCGPNSLDPSSSLGCEVYESCPR